MRRHRIRGRRAPRRARHSPVGFDGTSPWTRDTAAYRAQRRGQRAQSVKFKCSNAAYNKSIRNRELYFSNTGVCQQTPAAMNSDI